MHWLFLYVHIIPPKIISRNYFFSVTSGNPCIEVKSDSTPANTESDAPQPAPYEQLDLFTNYAAAAQAREEAELAREKNMHQTVITIKKKFGKNAILKGMNLEEGATTKDRNRQIGGHKE